MCRIKKQSQKVMGCNGSSTMNRVMPSGTKQPPLTFLWTVQFINGSSKLRLLCAEIDMGSFCTMISHDYLVAHLLNEPVDSIADVPCTYDKWSILTIQGTVNLRVCSAGCTMDAKVYMVGDPCRPLIG